ncbi:MAG: hypothetical protein R3F49_04890 [Planctomycetota bacterium]
MAPLTRTQASLARPAPWTAALGVTCVAAAATALGRPSAAPVASALQEAEPYIGAPIHYEADTRADAVARLTASVRAGSFRGTWDERHGWLPAALAAFDIPVESQVLVFSKTSLQADRISPTTPRAIYFNDEVVVAWIYGSPVMEVTALDPVQGPTFYALPQTPDALTLERRDDSCLTCHASPRTQGWPGHVIRSVHPDARGFPILRAGTYRTTDSSPLEERWGGWYVTGTHGAQRHMGNTTVANDAERVDLDAGANVTDLAQFLDLARYPSPHSDIVALLVLEHQCEMQNVLARGSYETRRALDYQHVLNEALKEPEGHVSDSTRRRIERAAEDIVDRLLFKDAAPLQAPVQGTSRFAEVFQARGKRDAGGRSLRDLELQRRLFRVPCSYMIESAAFAALPPELLEVIWRDLGAILHGREGARPAPQLDAEDRRAILEVLRSTLDTLPDGF